MLIVRLQAGSLWAVNVADWRKDLLLAVRAGVSPATRSPLSDVRPIASKEKLMLFPKPAKGTRRLEQRAKRQATMAHERDQKALVVRRDGQHRCRLVPGCAERQWHETAHLDDKGMGGDHGNRTTVDTMLRACAFHHQGAWSLHSGDLRVEYLTPEKANGPIEVWAKDAATGQSYLVGRESAVGVWDRD